MRNGRRHGSAHGFTLVELLVALSVSSILILAVYSAFDLGLMLWRRVEAPRTFEEQGRLVLNLMRTELAGLYWPNVQEQQLAPLEYFQERSGEQWKLSFFTTTPSHDRGLLPGRCVRVTYEYRRQRGQEAAGGVLIRRAALAAGEKVIADPTADVLAEGLAECKVMLRDAKGEAWQNEGDGSRQPPATVAFEMHWPDVAFAPGRTRPVRFQASWPIPVRDALMPDD